MAHTYLVDFHCHLDLYPDYERAFEEAERAGVFTLAVTTTPRAWPRNYDLTQNMRYVKPALGIHPQLVNKDVFSELALWDKYFPTAQYIGEVGLDAGPRFYRSLDVQKQVLQHVLMACAEAGGKVLSVHAVRSVGAVLDMVEDLLPPSRGCVVVLHWFSGSRAQAQRAVNAGCYFSVNAAMLRSDRGRALIQTLPSDRLLTETDGPFTDHNSRPNRPVDVIRCVGLLSELLNSNPLAISEIVADNLGRLLGRHQA